MDNQKIISEKSALRARFRSYRKSLDAETYRSRSAAILDHTTTVPDLQNAETVHVYWPMAGTHEVDTRPLIERLVAAGTRVALPCIVSFSAGAATRMEHRQYEGETCLACNRWGIHEPSGTPVVAPEEIDVVIVPAFGAGRNGHRIGHGRGYYDSFLAALPAFRICLIYHACLVDHVPAEPHDVPMDRIVTEHTVISPGEAV